MNQNNQGICYIVGAGPGDPGLITRRGLECLRRADAVYYDRLANDALLEETPSTCELIFVGKEPGKPGWGQQEICQCLISATGTGRIVVRLKGGDPFLFGRGGEEASALAQAGKRFEIVPGISAGIAAPAYAGIPVTHRGTANGVIFVTGHQREDGGEGEKVDWRELGALDHSLCVYMGVKNLRKICRELTAGGRAENTPAGLIENGTQPEQRCLEGTINDLPDKAESAGIKPPAILIIGKTVKLRQSCAWFEKRSLFGQLVLIPRPAAQNRDWSSLIKEEGGQTMEVPAIRIEPVALALPSSWTRSKSLNFQSSKEKRDNFDRLSWALLRLTTGEFRGWTVFTSRNGVEQIWERLRQLGLDARAFAGCRLAAVGPSTAAALHKYGLQADLLPANHSSAGLIEAFAGNRPQSEEEKSMLLLRSSRADPVFAEKLQSLGFIVTDIAAYHTRLPEREDNVVQAKLRTRPPDIVLFSSPSTVEGLSILAGEELAKMAGEPRTARFIAIGERTAEALAAAGLPCDRVCEKPEPEFILASLQER